MHISSRNFWSSRVASVHTAAPQLSGERERESERDREREREREREIERGIVCSVALVVCIRTEAKPLLEL
jgi:hypothetical protein